MSSKEKDVQEVAGVPLPPNLMVGVPVGTVCAFAGQVTPSSEGENTVWENTGCSPNAAEEGKPRKDEPVVVIEGLGWMLCDGRCLEVARYPELFGVLGYLYGQETVNGEQGFRIPDCRGLFLRGVDHGAGMDPDASERTGAKGLGTDAGVGSLQCDALQDHAHDGYYTSTAAAGNAADAVAYTGSGAATSSPNPPARVKSETRPENICVNYIIKYRD